MQWIKRGVPEIDDQPVEGHYRIMVSGDSEYLDGHCIYSFDDYETWGECVHYEGRVYFKGHHDEEDTVIFAYCGPFIIPEYKAD